MSNKNRDFKKLLAILCGAASTLGGGAASAKGNVKPAVSANGSSGLVDFVKKHPVTTGLSAGGGVAFTVATIFGVRYVSSKGKKPDQNPDDQEKNPDDQKKNPNEQKKNPNDQKKNHGGLSGPHPDGRCVRIQRIGPLGHRRGRYHESRRNGRAGSFRDRNGGNSGCGYRVLLPRRVLHLRGEV